MQISLIPSVEYLQERELLGKTVVIIDVLRATTVITTALANGADGVIPTLEIAEAMEYQGEEYLLGGERKALKIEGFDLSNSPLDYTKEEVAGKLVVLTTTNGTRTIHKARNAAKIYIACMRNGRAVANKLIEEDNDVVIACAGTYGRFSLDDFICAGKIIYDSMRQTEVALDDFAAAAYMAYQDNRLDVISYIKMASHYQYLMSIGLAEDIAYCFTEDKTDIIPMYSDDKITTLS